jgi:hypothetical protein
VEVTSPNYAIFVMYLQQKRGGSHATRFGKHTNGQTHLNFQQVRREAWLTSRAIAETADVPLRDEYLFELGAKVDQETRYKIIHALSRLTGHAYTLRDFEPEETTTQGAVSENEHTPKKHTQGELRHGQKHLY